MLKEAIAHPISEADIKRPEFDIVGEILCASKPEEKGVIRVFCVAREDLFKHSQNPNYLDLRLLEDHLEDESFANGKPLLISTINPSALGNTLTYCARIGLRVSRIH